jgi:LPXTG-motif cell wall-anchored protein
MLMFAFWLIQAAPDTGSDNSTMIRLGAGVLALICIAFILVRRKRKASKEDWS